jgi:hypothetical protein
MDAITGWFLILIILSSIAQSVAILIDNERFFKFSFLAVSTILAFLSLMVFQKAVIWNGPTIFGLDSFHQVRCHFRVSLWQLPLLWMTWWWMSDRKRDERASERFWFLAVLMIFLLCDDVWLWMITLIGCSCLQQSLLASKSQFQKGLSLLRGCHWMAILLLLVVVGILSFDFGIASYHELPETIQNWDNFTSAQQADLVLAAMLGSLSLILMTAVYPISVLRIDCEPENDLEPISLIFAAAVFIKLIPLFVLTNVTAIHSTLILLTVVVSMVCSWGLVEKKTVRQTVLTAFLMLGLFGMFLSSNPVLNTLGLEQFLLTVIMWRLWNSYDERTLSHRAAILFSGLWIMVGMSGWTLAIQSSELLGNNEHMTKVVLGVISVGLMVPFFREILADWKTLPAGIHPAGQRKSSGLMIIPIAFVIAVMRYWLWKQGEPWLIVPGWETIVGIIVGAGIAGILARRTSSEGVSRQRTGSFQRLAESHFHGLTIWKGIASIPTGVVTACASLLDLWGSRVERRFIHKENPLQSPAPFVWELALGGIGFLLLASLFLWMKG